MYRLNLNVFLITLIVTSLSVSNPLIQAPNMLSDKDIQKLIQEWSTCFTWSIKNCLKFSCIYQGGKAGFAFKFFEVPLYCNNYLTMPNIYALKRMFESNKYPYYFEEPLYHDSIQAQKIDIETIIAVIKNHPCIFYTGAGLSAASDVSTMKELETSLHMHNGLQHFLTITWKKPEMINQAFASFCKTALSAKPTKAHNALKKIVLEKKCAIITENVDLLQHKTGIEPIATSSELLRKIKLTDLKAIKYIICIGLSHDDRGFLAWYKQCNPHGMIIAIDLKQPDYLATNDLFLYADIQEIIPNIAAVLRKQL